jgi:nucleotide-binding universal stress UspA family protein
VYRHILVPVDSSACSVSAVQHAYLLSRLLGSKVTLLHVIPDGPQSLDAAHANASLLLKQLSVGARFAPARCVLEAKGRTVAEAVIETARSNGADLIVVGSHGCTGVERQVLGSVAQEIAGKAQVPVKVVPMVAPVSDWGVERWSRAAAHPSSKSAHKRDHPKRQPL